LCRSVNLRSWSSCVHLCSLRWIPSTRSPANFGSGSSASLFNDDLLAFQTHSANLLPPFAMYRALPGSDYYGGSAPPGATSRRRACPHTQRWGGQHRTVPTFTVDRSAGSATSFSPDSLATSTPQAFLVASRPARLTGRRSRVLPSGARARCPLSPYPPGWSRELDLRGFHHWFTARYAFLPRLPSPDRPAVPIRLVVVGAAPALTRASGIRLPPASNGPLRRAARWVLSSHPIR
jgi:hypothetical protein